MMVRKPERDNRLNLGFDYRDSLMQRNLSNHILRNQTILDFIGFLNDYMYNMLSSVKQLKQFKNYTVKKNDTNVR